MPDNQVITIEKRGESETAFLITTTNAESQDWIETQAPQFGHYEQSPSGRLHGLVIALKYDSLEVEKHLLSFNQKAE